MISNDLKRGHTFGEAQAGKMAAMQQAQQNMAPGTGGRGTLQQYEAMKQQQAMPAGVAQYGAQMQQKAPAGVPQYGPQTQPPPAIFGNKGIFGAMSEPTPPPAGMGPMGPTGPGTQTGGPAPMGMAPAGMAAMGAFKKGGAVKAKAFAEGGSVKATSMGSVKTAKPVVLTTSRHGQTFGDKMAARMAAQAMGPKPTLAGGGSVKAAKPKIGSASSRADGCAIRGKTRA
jgi:hypothetical protein